MSAAVSVCIPVHNGAEHVAAALSSVLGQTYTDLEVVVVDNASTDATAEVLARFDDPRLRVVRNDELLDVVANWNKATSLCTGRYVKLVCHDDALEPTCIERQVALLDAHPEAAMSAVRRRILDEDGSTIMRSRGLPGMDGLVGGREAIARCVRSGSNVFGEPAAVLVRGDVLRRVGPWDGRLPYMIDVEMWFRLLRHGALAAVPEPLAVFRVRRSSWSAALGNDQARQARELFRRVRAPEAGPVRVGAADLAIGSVRARALQVARGLLYLKPRPARA